MRPQDAIQAVTSALLALIALVGAFLIVFYQLVHNQDPKLPDFVGILMGGVVASYLTHVASVNGARQAGTAAAQTAVNKLTDVGGAPPNAGSVTPNP